jgi:hypothetical protein
METRNLPIGIQDFKYIRDNDCVYVDKTAYVYKMAKQGKPYFLSRPRRFGKSLMVSTLKAYFEGKKEFFKGLAIAELEKDWTEHPVFLIDLNVGEYGSVAELNASLGSLLRVLESEWGADAPDEPLSSRFNSLIRRAAEKTGKNVVVLIDEYDKPLVQHLENDSIQKEFRAALKSFYGVLKSADPWLRFVFITGVSKFSHVSIFSDMNQLRDISMDRAFAGICGITEPELIGTFEPEIQGLADGNKMTRDEALAEMRKCYNGYRFAPEAETVYNPFSVLNTLARQTFGYYWFRTGTPTFLVEQIKNAKFNIPDFTNGVSTAAQSIDDYRAAGDNPVPLLYQTGYLTIRDYEPRLREYTLGFPNEEVKYAFLGELLDSYLPKAPNLQGLSVTGFIKDLWKQDIEAFMTRLRSLIASMPYGVKSEETESWFQTVVYLLFVLMGQYIQAEVHSRKGRADAVVITDESVYVFEFKITDGESGKTAEDALKQIEEKDYMGPYRASGKRLVKIGAIYDTAKRELGEVAMVVSGQ